MNMKNTKIILLVLIGVLLICSFGCGGRSGLVDDEDAESQEEYTQQQQQEQTNENVSNLVDKILSPGSDGSPIIFDYAPKPEVSDESAVVDLQEVQFVKYISSKDLNSNDEYVQTIRLNKDSEYVIKYSHSGRSLNNSVLGLRITAPDDVEMILDPSLSENSVVSDDASLVRELTEEEIQTLLEESEITLEELEAEKALDGKETESSEHHYVKTELEVIPEENPCIIMYSFKAPLTGDYEFAISELTLVSDDGLVKNASSDIPFEFRIYGTEESYSASDGEEIELSPRDILDIQRLLLSSATEFNENGLPTNFTSDEADESDVEASSYGYGWLFWGDTRGIISEKLNAIEQNKKREQQSGVVVDAIINNVPYDYVFEQGAGFHAHSGLRAVTNIIDDSSYRDNIVQNFSMPTPETDDALNLKENFSVNVVATQEEHDRTMELEAMSNFALLRDALGYTKREDYARLGSDYTRVISARYELIEEQPRMPDTSAFKVYDEALEIIEEYGIDYFLDQYGDYFVAGYTWGTRYSAMIEIVTVPGESYYNGARYPYRVNDAALICSDALQCVQELLNSVRDNAIKERDTGNSDSNAKARITRLTRELQNNFHNVTITVHATRVGTAGDLSLSIYDFVNTLGDFIKSAKTTSKSQYAQLYVTLIRFR